MLLQQHLNHFFYLFIHSFSFSNLFSLLNSLIFGLLWPDLGCHFWSSFQIWVVVVVVVARVSCQCQCRWVWFWWLSQLGWIASVWHGNGNCGRVSCLGPQLAGIVHFGSCLMDLFNPISGRDASHTTRKESTSEDKMPSQKFKYRRKRLLARTYGPRRPSYLFLLLKEILRPYLHKQIIYESNPPSLLNKSALTNILPNDEKSRRLLFSEGKQLSLTTICKDLYTFAISYLRIPN